MPVTSTSLPSKFFSAFPSITPGFETAVKALAPRVPKFTNVMPEAIVRTLVTLPVTVSSLPT